jgi:hypothetical protein
MGKEVKLTKEERSVLARMAPLGPIRRVKDYYLDQMGHEYTSIEHVALCAVAKALGVSR